MAEVELSPSELDRLEDALEDLEHAGALDRWLEDESSPQVRGRLADYRSILAMSRRALPLEDVPSGVLDGVLAEAQQAAALAPAAAAAAASEGTWWSRVRRSFMMPALALAGTAVLVLWVFDPADQAKLTEPPAPATASAPATAVESESRQPEAPAAREPLAPNEPMPESEDQAIPPPAAQPAAPADPAQAEGGAPGPALESKKDEKPTETKNTGMASLGEVPGSVSGGVKAAKSQQSSAGSSAGAASGRWDLVSRGDRARQAGDCVGARDEYALALEDDEPRVRARAYAGLGLCDAKVGDEPSADANFERARELDGDVGRFIDSQQERSRPTQKRKSAAKKAPSPLPNALDPY